MEREEKGRILEYLREEKDPRVERRKLHLLYDILVIALLASLCGADTFVQMESFGRSKEEWLREFLSLRHGIPSHDTFARVFAALEPEEFYSDPQN